MEKSRLEIMVGFFVVLALIILSFMVFFISGVFFFRQGYSVNVRFNYVSGIEKGAPVRQAGVPIGKVSDVRVIYSAESKKPIVELRLSIDKDFKIQKDALIRIQGIYGLSTPHLEITANRESAHEFIGEGDVLQGVDPVPIEDLVKKGEAIAERLEETINRINNALKDEEIREALRGIFVNVNKLTQSLNDIVSGREEEFNSIIRDLGDSSARLKSILEKIDQGEGTAGKLVSDEELYEEITAFVRDLKAHPWKLLKRGGDEGARQAKEAEKKKRFGIF